MFMALVTSLVVLFYCCVAADILTKLLQQCFLIFIVLPWLYLGNSQVSVYRTIGPTLVFTCNYVVSVWRGFLFLWVLGMGYVILLLLSLSLPYNYFATEEKTKQKHN